jgi:hypothetical protein
MGLYLLENNLIYLNVFYPLSAEGEERVARVAWRGESKRLQSLRQELSKFQNSDVLNDKLLDYDWYLVMLLSF